MPKDENKNNELRLRNHDEYPTPEVLEKVLGKSFDAYVAFQEALPELEIEQEWQWYTPHKAWFARGQYRWTGPRGVDKEKTIYWAHFFDGYFNVAVWFKEKNRQELFSAKVSEGTKQLICNTATFGKVPTFPVEIAVHTKEQLADIYELIKLKKKLEA
ncbi:MAG: DUF3788 domain-containing protein [Firmicutes bacterium]|nr:DUF3788 domain-containing protein [Bacillota bacterium]